MPTETTIAARDRAGAQIIFHDTPYPPIPIVEMFEKHHKGSVGEFLEMVKNEQAVELNNRDRASRVLSFTRIAGMCFAFVLIILLVVAGTFLVAMDKPIGGYSSLFMGILSAICTIASGGRLSSQRHTPQP